MTRSPDYLPPANLHTSLMSHASDPTVYIATISWGAHHAACRFRCLGCLAEWFRWLCFDAASPFRDRDLSGVFRKFKAIVTEHARKRRGVR